MTVLTLYHGTGTPFVKFDPAFLGIGTDQEGPGVYLTTDVMDARRYGKYIMTVEGEFRKFVPLTGRIPRTKIATLISRSPDRDYALTNYDENPSVAFKTAVDSICTYSEGPHDAFQYVMHDFYRDDPAAFMREMVRLGYDGVKIERNGGVTHFVAYNIDTLKILNYAVME